MSNMNQIASDLYKAITEADSRKPQPYDTKAEVQRIEGDTVWVKIPGGDDETPVQRTNNANAGDTVMVRVSGGRAWLLGNNTSPATDDTMANQAYQIGSEAGKKANSAIENANIAQMAADRAQEMADIADNSAKQAEQAALDAVADAETARISAEGAQDSAEAALQSAQDATSSANLAIKQLSIVENIVGVLDLVAKNGDYKETQDLEVQSNKWYFNRLGSGTEQDPYRYEVVRDPEGDPSAQGWYELVGVDSAIQNYVSSHLVLVGNSLFLQNGEDNTKIELSTTDGVVMYDTGGAKVAKYGATTSIGNGNGFHITMDGTKLGFWRGNEENPQNEIAYITGQKLYITQSVVLEEMAVGKQQADGGLGQWSWKVHPNDENPSRNNLYLKWIG